MGRPSIVPAGALLSLVLFVVLGCSSATRIRDDADGVGDATADGDVDTDVDSDTDVDTDTDVDVDVDVDTDTDADADGDAGCVPGRSEPCGCADGRRGAQVCRDDGTWGECECTGTVDPDPLLAEFERVTAGMVGSWHGTVWTPWTGEYEVDVTFTDDGQYWATCTFIPGCSPFYWGAGGTSELHRYQTVDIYASFEVWGDIHLVHDSGATRDVLDRIVLSTDGDALTFEIWRRDRDHGGPPMADLTRVEP